MFDLNNLAKMTPEQQNRYSRIKENNSIQQSKYAQVADNLNRFSSSERNRNGSFYGRQEQGVQLTS